MLLTAARDLRPQQCSPNRLAGLQRRWLLPFSVLLIVAAALLAFLLDAAPARAEGLKLRPAHPRRSAEGPGRYRWFAALSWFCETHQLQRHIGIMQMSSSGGEPVPIPAASGAILPLNVSQDGAELLVKDNQGTEYRGSFGDSQSSGVRPADWALLLGRTRPGRPMAGCWFTPTEANCFWPGATGRNPES